MITGMIDFTDGVFPFDCSGIGISGVNGFQVNFNGRLILQTGFFPSTDLESTYAVRSFFPACLVMRVLICFIVCIGGRVLCTTV